MRGEREEDIRTRNPFRDPLVTELIEDPALYHRMFSQRILVGETLQVFQPANVVLVGPLGSGKSMILNLVRYTVLAEWISANGGLPAPLEHVEPFLGISVNLLRANFHVFGRRSVSRAMQKGRQDENLDATCAADFLSHYLLREFVKAVCFLLRPESERLCRWLAIVPEKLHADELAAEIASWDSWFGYYSGCRTLRELVLKSERRLSAYLSFLNANTDRIPRKVWETKSALEGPLHSMGNLLASLKLKGQRLPLYVLVDQYEVLPQLNEVYGTTLQRVVNTLIKARDPVVFYKIGARTYDWGKELRIWGADSTIEVQRDYVLINLADVLMRRENARWIFPAFATDVAHKRMLEAAYSTTKKGIKGIFGGWSADDESTIYFAGVGRRSAVIRRVGDKIKARITQVCGEAASPLELRLASAWALQKLSRRQSEGQILRELGRRPWRSEWWRKERDLVALLQVASLANQRKRYYGWKTVLYLSGANIMLFLLLCGETWDAATKMGLHPINQSPLKPQVQTEGIIVASEKWRARDRNDRLGGSLRYHFLSRLGQAIHNALIDDLAISNPGHSGFSLRESDLVRDSRSEKVAEFLQQAVNYAILEERLHTSKSREGTTRRKWYLHPLLSPAFDIPYMRVKEPLYLEVDDVYQWIYAKGEIRWGKMAELPSPRQIQLAFPKADL